jgi:hypothetical protein
MARSDTKRIVVRVACLLLGRPVSFRPNDHEDMLDAAVVEEAYFLHDCATSSDILVRCLRVFSS